MTKRGETTNMGAAEFIETIERFIDKAKLDYVIVNNGFIAEEIIEKYQKEEQKKPIKITNIEDFQNTHYKIIERDIVNDEDVIRHDPEKLSRIIDDIVDGWIK